VVAFQLQIEFPLQRMHSSIGCASPGEVESAQQLKRGA
jgi:hypothetical protein